MQRKRVLAAGPNSATLLVHDTNANDLKVLKRINAASWSPSDCNDALDVLHRSAEHPVPVMVSVEQAVVQNAFLNIVMPYFCDGSLADFMRDNRSAISQTHVVQWVHVVALAVRSTHRLGLVHAGIRCANVFLSSDRGAAGIIAGPPTPLVRYRERVRAAKQQHDLQGAAAIHLSNGNQSISGLSLELTFPPEALAESFRYDAASDVWHLGALLMSLAGPQSLSSPTAESAVIRRLVNAMCEDDPSKRPSIDAVVRELHQLHSTHLGGGSANSLKATHSLSASLPNPTELKAAPVVSSTHAPKIDEHEARPTVAARSSGRLANTPPPSSSSPDPVRPAAEAATGAVITAAAETPSGMVVSPRRQRPSPSATVGRNLPRTLPISSNSSGAATGGNVGAGYAAAPAAAPAPQHAHTTATSNTAGAAAPRTTTTTTRGGVAANPTLQSRNQKPAGVASPYLSHHPQHELPQSSSSPTSPPSSTAGRAVHVAHQAFLHAFLEDDNVEAQRRRDEVAREQARRRERHLVELRTAQQVHQQHSTNLRKIRVADNAARRDTIRQSIRLWQQQQPQQGASGGALLSHDDGVAIFAKAGGPQQAIRPDEQQRQRHFDYYPQQDGFDAVDDEGSHEEEEDRCGHDRDGGVATSSGGGEAARTPGDELREAERSKAASANIRRMRQSSSFSTADGGQRRRPHSEDDQVVDSPLTAQGSASLGGDEYELSSDADGRHVRRRVGGANTGGADPVRIEITPPRRNRGYAPGAGQRSNTGRVPSSTTVQSAAEPKKADTLTVSPVDARNSALHTSPSLSTPPPQQQRGTAASAEYTVLSLDASPSPSEGGAAARDTAVAPTTTTAQPATGVRASPDSSSSPSPARSSVAPLPSTSAPPPSSVAAAPPLTTTDDIAAVAALEWSSETTSASLRRLFSSDDDPTLRKVAAEVARFAGLPPRHRCQATLAAALFNTVHRIVMETEGLSVAAGERAVLVASSAVQVAALDSVAALAAEFRGRPAR